MNRTGRILLLAFAFLIGAAAAKAPPALTILAAEAALEYPETITFSIEAESDSEIQVLELEYGLTGRDCTPDVNIIVPENFSPSSSIQSEWTWDIGESGNLPPGMRIWWNWHLMDAAGNEVRSEKAWITWIDSIHHWKSIVSENIILHWYQGTEAYHQNLMKTAETARDLLRNDVGAWPSGEIHLYLYGSNQDMKDALVGEPDWIGGLSFGGNQRTIIIGIDPGNEDWGKLTISHELAHTAVDSIMGGCYATLPLWLNEGIAMYAEGGLDQDYLAILDEAIYYDSLFSLRAISFEYQYINDDPTLTYAESYSVVKYLVEEYGNSKIHLLLQTLGEGYTYDNSLLAALGVDMDELEDGWRENIGADPMLGRTPRKSPAAMLQTTLPPVTSSFLLSTPTPDSQGSGKETPAGGPLGRELRALLEYPWKVIAACGLGALCVLGIGGAGILLVFGKRKINSGR